MALKSNKKDKKHVKIAQKGFTIIEVLIVLTMAALILIIVFLAVPAMQRNARNYERKNYAETIMGNLTNFPSKYGTSTITGHSGDPVRECKTIKEAAEDMLGEITCAPAYVGQCLMAESVKGYKICFQDPAHGNHTYKPDDYDEFVIQVTHGCVNPGVSLYSDYGSPASPSNVVGEAGHSHSRREVSIRTKLEDDKLLCLSTRLP